MNTSDFSGSWQRDTLNGQDFLIYSIFHQGKTIATLCLYHTTATVNGKEIRGYFVDDINVQDEWKKLGLGKYLLDKVEHILAKRKTFVYLSTAYLIQKISMRVGGTKDTDGYREKKGFIIYDTAVLAKQYLKKLVLFANDVYTQPNSRDGAYRPSFLRRLF